MLEKIKKYKSYYISILYFFRQATQFIALYNSSLGNRATYGGNLDPFYLFGFFEFMRFMRIKKVPKKFLAFFGTIFVMAIIQFVFISNLDLARFGINIFKIFLCVLAMLYFSEKNISIDVKKVLKILTYLYIIFTVLSLTVMKGSILWRLKDFTNIYSLERLQLFYLEPSELGFHVAIVIICLFGLLLKEKKLKEKFFLLIYIGLNMITLMFAKSMGAIAILFVTIAIMLVLFFKKRLTKTNLIIFALLLSAMIVVLLMMYRTNNPILKRVIDTFNGKDNSSNYRVGASVNVLFDSLDDYSYIGCGLGNLNTSEFIGHYSKYKLVQMMVNSFLYFMTETGIFGIIYVLVLIIYLIIKCKKSKSIIKAGLLFFLIFYQFVGSHFTNGLVWCLYGLIININFDFGDKETKNENLLHN